LVRRVAGRIGGAGAFRRTSARKPASHATIDYDRRRVLRDDTEIRLTPKEFELLSLLARNHDRVLTHRAILKAIWGPNAVEQPEHLWTLVAQLRRKIEPDPTNPRYLLSEPWVGYRFATAIRERARTSGNVRPLPAFNRRHPPPRTRGCLPPTSG
jgi:two-component system KDP operon response regulator KdpE